MASGRVNRAHRGRTHGRTDQYGTREESPCQLGAVHTWPINAQLRRGISFVVIEGIADLGMRWSRKARSRMTPKRTSVGLHLRTSSLPP
jgi:hypothetical protein